MFLDVFLDPAEEDIFAKVLCNHLDDTATFRIGNCIKNLRILSISVALNRVSPYLIDFAGIGDWHFHRMTTPKRVEPAEWKINLCAK
jgi:hypothetical protein